MSRFRHSIDQGQIVNLLSRYREDRTTIFVRKSLDGEVHQRPGGRSYSAGWSNASKEGIVLESACIPTHSMLSSVRSRIRN